MKKSSAHMRGQMVRIWCLSMNTQHTEKVIKGSVYVIKRIAVVHRGKVIIIIIIEYYRLSHDVVTLGCKSQRFDCVLLVFIRRWGRLVNAKLYKAWCSAVIGWFSTAVIGHRSFKRTRRPPHHLRIQKAYAHWSILSVWFTPPSISKTRYCKVPLRSCQAHRN